MKKPKLPADLQVAHLKAHGVTFAYMSEREAIAYLETNHNYFKLKAFRRLFPLRYDGTYMDLDFGCLRDLYIMDTRLRACLLPMCMDVEHHARMLLMKAFDLSLEDGYEIVADFEAENGADVRSACQAAARSPYAAPLIVGTAGPMPLWTFMELLPFDLFVRFFDFVAWHLHDAALIDHSFRLMTVADLRAVLVSGHPVLSDMNSRPAKHRVNHAISHALGRMGISKSTRRRKLQCETLRQITTLLYVYDRLVPRSDMRAEQEDALRRLSQRLMRHQHFYKEAQHIASSLRFLSRLLDSMFPPRYTDWV